MKKIILLLAALALIYANAISQGCLPEGITFYFQEQIDNFQTNYPGCTEIEGIVTINGTGITNLNGLNILTSIGWGLVIGNNVSGNPSLTSLTGLENLASIGGSITIGGRYQGNPSLTSLTGLDNLTIIGSDMLIGYNNTLTSLTGLENLTTIVGEFTISNNSSLSTCDAGWLCDYLSAPTGAVNIYGNATGCNSIYELATACGGITCLPYGNYYFHSQSDIDNFQAAFPNCTELQGDVYMSGNDITDLSGLDLVTSIGGGLWIYNSPLTSLTGLDNLASIGGNLTIGGDWNANPSLTSLTWFMLKKQFDQK
ncbi:MAG: hypothetical protein K0B15_16885 [Lentimicrobium sp.]|nr:hypothetical protein [Lentimicrobium sp.]